ncbi:STAS domain-containing protein [Nonomuraea gerenzanensis]|uniref:STAS domain-containing protein n=1 Tax=Nonomuraea gerenzanensis TaxID=93944 RepID=UPI001CDA52A5|nr:STAS domain-containing protein [Nonomuraea gerenzanensis]UBU18742.1 STAS domain-containing protein [Nonomuraea gerenzanensis]
MTGVYVQEVADLNVEVQRGGCDARVRLTGDLDKLTAPLLKDALVQLFTEGRVEIVIDAGKLDFCDSSGLWVLVEHQRRVSAHAGSLGLVGVHGVLQRVLDVTGLKAAFDRVVPAEL